MADLSVLPSKSIAKIELAKFDASERLRHALRLLRSDPGEDTQVELCIAYADYVRDIYFAQIEEYIEQGCRLPSVWNRIAQQTALSALASWKSSGGRPGWKDFFVDAAFKSIKASPRHEHVLKKLLEGEQSPSPDLSLPPDPFVQPEKPSCERQDAGVEGKSVETDKSQEPEVAGVHTNSRTVTSGMADNPFDKTAINQRIATDFARIRSAWLEWIAEPTEGEFDTKMVEMLVNTLDAHAGAYLEAVNQASLISEYVHLLRRIGTRQIEHLEGGYLADPNSDEQLRKRAESSGNYIRKKYSLTPEEQEAEIREEVERLRFAAIPEALKWREHRGEILTRLETRFEARYSHWTAEAMDRVRNRSAQHSDTGNNMPDPKESSMQSRPGEKSDTSFWRDLEAQFRAIADSGAMLRADWDYIVGRGRSRDWKLTGGASNSVRVRFQSLATRAGIAINTPGDLTAFEAWLELLREQSPNSHQGRYGIERQNDGTEGAHHMPGTVENVCEASADQCALLETRALEIERGRHGPAREVRASTVAPLALEAQLPELPLPFQDVFEGSRAQAELDFANRGHSIPNSPEYANHPIHRAVLIQEVFFCLLRSSAQCLPE